MKRLTLFALLATLAISVPASAQSSSLEDGYGNRFAEISTVSPNANSADPSDPGTQSLSDDSLPFTGFEALLVALGGAALLGTGLAARRLSQPQA